jgi:hypothetical protein
VSGTAYSGTVAAVDLTTFATAGETVDVYAVWTANSVVVTFDGMSKTYGDAPFVPVYTLKYGGNTISNAGETLSSGNTVVATVGVDNKTLSIKASGSSAIRLQVALGAGGVANYDSVSKSVVLTVGKRVIDNSDVQIIVGSATFSGDALEPSVSVTDGNVNTSIGVGDWSVSAWGGNTDAGTGSVTISGTGNGNYTGSKTQTFEILQKSIAGVSVSCSIDTMSYTGSAIVIGGSSISVSDVDRGGVLGEEDYEVRYRNNVAVGRAYIDVYGRRNYSGVKLSADSFAIVSKEMSGSVLIEDIVGYDYDGTSKEPHPVVRDGSSPLVEGTHYDLVWSNNVNANGNAVVTVKGKSPYYSGEKDKGFEIRARALTVAMIASIDTVPVPEYTGMPLTPRVEVRDGGTLTAGDDYRLVYSNNVNAGSGARVTIVGIGNYRDSVVRVFRIGARDIGGGDISVGLLGSVEYSGVGQCPAGLTVTDGGRNGIALTGGGVDYSFACTDNVGVGRATVTVSGVNNYRGIRSVGFDISKARLRVRAHNMEMSYGMSPDSLSLLGEYDITDYVGGEGADSIDVLPVVRLHSALSALTDAGEYVDYVLVSGAVDNNYEFEYVGGMFKVVRRLGELQGFNPVLVKDYGDAPFGLSARYVPDGGYYGGSAVQVRYSTTDGSTIGLSEDLQGSLTGEIKRAGEATLCMYVSGNSNHSGDTVCRAVQVRRQPISIRVNDVRIKYGEAISYTFSVDGSGVCHGLCNTGNYGDGLSVLTGAGLGVLTVVPVNGQGQVDTGRYTIRIGGVDTVGISYRVETYEEGTLRVERNTQSVDFGVLGTVPADTGYIVLGALSNRVGVGELLPITYSSNNENVATVGHDTLYIHRSGSVIVSAQQLGNSHYEPSGVMQQELAVYKARPRGTFATRGKLRYGQRLEEAEFDGSLGTVGYTAGRYAFAEPLRTPAFADSMATLYTLYFVPTKPEVYDSIKEDRKVAVSRAQLNVYADNLTAQDYQQLGTVFADGNIGDMYNVSGVQPANGGLQLNDDRRSIFSVPPVVHLNVGSAQGNAGVYYGAVEISGGVAANYAISYEKGDLTVISGGAFKFSTDSIRVYGEAAFVLSAVHPASQVGDAGYVDGSTATDGIWFTTADAGVVDVSYDAAAHLWYGEIKGADTVTLTAHTGNTSAGTGFTEVSRLFNVGVASLRVKADRQQRSYKEGEPTFTYTASGWKYNDESSASSILADVRFGTDAVNSSVPGKYSIEKTVEAGATASRNYVIEYVGDTLTVVKAGQAITFAALPEVPADTGYILLEALSDNQDGLPVSYVSSDVGVAHVGHDTLYVHKAGLTQIIARQLGGSNYEAAIDAEQYLTVRLAVPKVRWPDSARLPAYGVRLGSLEGNMYFGGVRVNYRYGNLAPAADSVGLEGLAYTQGSQPAALGTVVGGGIFVYEEDYSLSERYYPHVRESGKLFTLYFLPNRGEVYADVRESVKMIVPRAVLTVKASSDTLMYGNDPRGQTYSYNVSGLVNGDRESVIWGDRIAWRDTIIDRGNGLMDTLVWGDTIAWNDNIKVSTAGYSPVLTDTSHVGIYVGALQPLGGHADDYRFEYVGGDLTIVRTRGGHLSFASMSNKEYGEVDFQLTGGHSLRRVVEFGSNDASKVEVYYDSGNGVWRGKIKGVGAASVYARYGGDADVSSDSIAQSFYISAALLNVVFVDTFRYYGDENPSFRYTVIGLCYGEDVSVLGSISGRTPATSHSIVGDYPIEVGIGGNNANYEFRYHEGWLNIRNAERGFFRVSGSVSGLASNANVRVYYSVNGAEQQEVVQTDVAGTYRIANIPELGTISLSAETRVGYRVLEVYTNIVIAGHMSAIDFHYQGLSAADRYYVISGTVRTDGQPDGRRAIYYKTDNASGQVVSIDGETNERGEYQIVVSRGMRVEVSASYRSGYEVSPVRVEIADIYGDTTGVDFDYKTLLPGTLLYRIEGFVSGLEGRDREGVSLYYEIEPQGGSGYVTTDQGGRYQIEGVTGGKVITIKASEVYGYVLRTGAQQHTVTGAAVLPDFEYQKVSPVDYTVSGKVSGLTSVSGVEISYTLDGGARQTVFTDASGAYSIVGIAAQTEVLIIPEQKTGYCITVLPGRLLVSGDIGDADVSYGLASTSADGYAVYAGGQAATGIDIYASENGGVAQVVRTDSRGHYVIAVAAGSALTVRPSYQPRYTVSPEQQTVQIGYGRTEIDTFVYSVSGESYYDVSGRLIGLSAEERSYKPIVYTVRLSGSDVALPSQVYTDARGAWQLPALPNGAVVEITPPRFAGYARLSPYQAEVQGAAIVHHFVYSPVSITPLLTDMVILSGRGQLSPAFKDGVFDYDLRLYCKDPTLGFSYDAEEYRVSVNGQEIEGSYLYPYYAEGLGASAGKVLRVEMQNRLVESAVREYRLHLYASIKGLMIQFYDDIMAVNLASPLLDGYEFTGFRWKTSADASSGWTVIAGAVKANCRVPLTTPAYYMIEMITAEDTLRGCPMMPAVFTGVSLEGETGRQLQAYPNPAHEHITVANPEWTNASAIEVYSLTGTQVRTYKTNGYYQTISAKELPAGAYIIKCGKLTTKIIVQ